MSVIGLSAFALFSVWRWRIIPALSPVLLLAGLAFVSGRRFIFYLAPFVGIGWGVIVFLVTRALLNRLGEQWDKPDAVPKILWSTDWLRATRSLSRAATFQSGVVYAAIIIVYFAWFAPASGEQSALSPAIPGQVFRQSASPRKTVAG